MQELSKGLARIRKGFVWNWLSGLFLFVIVAGYYLTYSPDKTVPELVPFMAIVCGAYFIWMAVTLLAVVYQYSGAIALLKSCRREAPPHRSALLASAVLIIADPLFNLLSAVGMLVAPRGFLKGRERTLWLVAIPLLAVGQAGNCLMALFLPGTPGAYDDETWIFIILNLACVALNFLAYLVLYVLYGRAEKRISDVQGRPGAA